MKINSEFIGELEAGDRILLLDDITVSFDGFKALNSLSLTIDYKELRCVIGANGAGKSTMMDVITGKTKPDSGQAIFAKAVDLTKLDPPSIAELGIGRKFQKPTVFTNLTVFENLELSMQADKRFFKKLFARSTSEQKDKIAQTAELIGLSDRAYFAAGALSHGQKQWLEIGALIMQNPKLMLIDEPVAGMTSAEVEKTREILTALAKDHAVVVVEHDMEFIRSLDAKVTVLHEGSTLAEGSMQSVQANEQVRKVYLGE
ncbi:MAG: urea ABC transporter ATP-binding protein UrtD [Helicobacteraceae bacterium]|jgi:urea transport system ATP-binding protein|nr:urea ABC transporter ATP-binding protein UrtD [Helicobacteraceae bacterium]